MGDRESRFAVAVGLIVLVVSTGCGSDSPTHQAGPPTAKNSSSLSSGSPAATAPSTPVLSYVDNAVGFGEHLRTSYGTHRVLTVHDPVSDTVLNVPSGMHAVRVPIEECVRSDHAAVTITAMGWTMVTTHPRDSTSPALGLQPAVDGFPPISRDGRVQSGRCVIGDLLFVIRDGSVLSSIDFRRAGDQTGRWADVGR